LAIDNKTVSHPFSFFLVLTLVVVLLITGCLGKAVTGFDSDYPRTWPNLALTNGMDCPDISGTFKEIGAYTYKYFEHQPLESLTYRLVGSPATTTAIVEISRWDEDALLVEVRNGSVAGKSHKLSRSRGDFSCDAQGVSLNPKVIQGAEGVGGARVTLKLGLKKAIDGSLVGEERMSSVGLVMWVIPITGDQTYWFRWQSVVLGSSNLKVRKSYSSGRSQIAM
jgi:hypothetical protein